MFGAVIVVYFMGMRKKIEFKIVEIISSSNEMFTVPIKAFKD